MASESWVALGGQHVRVIRYRDTVVVIGISATAIQVYGFIDHGAKSSKGTGHHLDACPVSARRHWRGNFTHWRQWVTCKRIQIDPSNHAR